jgi:intracellular sulfur oxidation DsrE/DsrF family protein
MKHFLLITALLSFKCFPAFCQEDNLSKPKTEIQQKLYLPAVLLDDAAALEKAMPEIAKQVLASFPQKGTSYYRQVANYLLLTGDYKKVSDAIDSVRNAENNPNWRTFFKTYAEAKIKDSSEGALFRQFLQKEFVAAYKTYSFDQKVEAASLDSLFMQGLDKRYKDWIAELKKNNSDSITLEEAKNFCSFYRDYFVFPKIFPLLLPYINEPKYKTTFPAIKGNTWGGVVPVDEIDEIPDPKLQYNFVMELTSFGMPKEPDSVTSKEINIALRSVARTINLHVGAGIPKEKINVVLAVHGSALNVFLTNEKYKKKYGVDNPNLPLLKELQDFGVRIALCGQAMYYQKNPIENFIQGVKVALTAQTVISSYQLKKYVFSDLSLRE